MRQENGAAGRAGGAALLQRLPASPPRVCCAAARQGRCCRYAHVLQMRKRSSTCVAVKSGIVDSEVIIVALACGVWRRAGVVATANVVARRCIRVQRHSVLLSPRYACVNQYALRALQAEVYVCKEAW